MSHMADGRRLWSAKADPTILGDGLLVIFMPDDWPPQMSEDARETYADWAEILEAFVRRSGTVKDRRHIDFRRADEFFQSPGLPVNEYTLLFVRKDGLALYANEPIFDGALYDYAEAFLGGMENDFYWQGILHAGETDAGMPRALKLVKLKANSQLKPVEVAPAEIPPAVPVPDDPNVKPTALPGPPVLYTPLP